jgi:glycosyltransferase involved in cell wall biosynthesis
MRMSCRFLFLIGQLQSGGSERQLYYLLEAMDRQRYRPALAVWNFQETDPYVAKVRAMHVPVYGLESGPSAWVKLRAFRRLVRQLDPEVVHSYTFYTNFAAQWSVRQTRAIAVGSVRGDFTLDKKDAGQLLGRLSARWPRDQIFNSLAAAETCRRTSSLFAPKRLHIVRNRLALEAFRDIALSPPERAKAVGIGSLVPVKRWDRLLRAALALKTKGLDCNIQIAGVGKGRELLNDEARRLDIADRVHFLGHTDDVAGLLAGASFLVHTSDSEGYPNVILEAMACARAVIAMDAGDVPSLVEDGKTGFVVPRGDESTLVARMVTLLTDLDLCRRMGEAGRARVEQFLDLSRLVSETLGAYRAMGWKDA